MTEHLSTPVRRIDAATLRNWLGDGQEIALVDVRDGGPFARSHLLVASNLPLARLEVLAPALLPRRTVRVVLMDAGEGFAERAAAVLAAHGYSGLHLLSGGVQAWADEGYELFSGTHVPSKAFGEMVEHGFDTPRIEPHTLHQWQQEGRDLVLVDARPLEEYRMVSLPGAADCPGAELALRVPALVRSPQTVVVVNCAGRTRSIIGCQSLLNAGITNQVFALKNGTMGWQLAGFQPLHGRDNLAPEPDAEGLAAARACAQDVAQRYDVRFIDRAQLRAFQAEPQRTTYLLDVRLADAFAAGHLAGSVHAPGGQLVQATDTYAAVRHARIVLVDRDGVQAVMTAHWLLQMGWDDVHVLRGGLDADLETGPACLPMLGEQQLNAPLLTVAQLQERIAAANAVVVDVGESYWYRSARIPGAHYAMRSQLERALSRFDRSAPLVFTCADGRVSRCAAQDARTLGYTRAAVLGGGRAAWRAAGAPTEVCPADDDPLLLTATDDMWYPPWARNSGVTEAMQQYLTWEVNLLEQLAHEPYLQFRVGRPPAHAAP
jgi:rhodanese-related sulfurtransferase